MSSDQKTTTSAPTVRFPMGCTMALLDLMGVIYVITHWGEVARGIAHLFQRFGL